jgi:hypothetical protein
MHAISIVPSDTCSLADNITGFGSWTLDTFDATHSGFEGNGGICDGVEMHKDVFWIWTPAQSGAVQFDTNGSGFDTQMSIHLGADCSATCLDLDDDSGGFNYFSRIVLNNVTAGQPYLVQVGSWTSPLIDNQGQMTPHVGDAVLNIGEPAAGVANDSCGSPFPAVGVGSYPFDTNGCSSSLFGGGGGACGPTITNDLFVRWVATQDGSYRFKTCFASHNTEMSVHAGHDCNALCIDSSDWGCGDDAIVDVENVAIGDQLLIQIGSPVNGFGQGDLVVELLPPPVGNTCADPGQLPEATWVSWEVLPFTTTGFDGGDPTNCLPQPGGGYISKDRFFLFTVPCDGDWTFTAFSNDIVPALNVHDFNGCGSTCLASSANTAPANWTAVQVTGLFQGEQILVQAGSAALATGAGVLAVAATRPAGDCPDVSVEILCDPAQPHWQGGIATLETSGFDPNSPSGLHLEVTDGPTDRRTDGPTGELGYFVVAQSATSSIPLHSGILCLDQPLTRYSPQVATIQELPQLNSVGVFDASGTLQNLVGTSTTGSGFDVPLELPYSPPGQTIDPGEVWYFQVWYRDRIGSPPVAGSSANFTNVVKATFWL